VKTITPLEADWLAMHAEAQQLRHDLLVMADKLWLASVVLSKAAERAERRGDWHWAEELKAVEVICRE